MNVYFVLTLTSVTSRILLFQICTNNNHLNILHIFLQILRYDFNVEKKWRGSIMKEAFIDNSMNIIKKYYPNYSEVKLAELKYGLLALYLLISKSIIIFGIALILGIFKELLIFTLIYNFIRLPSFGIHASKSWICLVVSSMVFILTTYLCNAIIIPINFKIVLGIFGIILMNKNAPADTAKKPIISPKRRFVYKTISTFLAFIFVICSLIIENSFLANSFVLALIIQCVIIAPTTYKICGETYDNYKSYQQ